MSSASLSVRRPRIALPASVAAMIAILAVGIVGVIPAAAVAPAVPGPGFTDFVYKPDADGSGGDDVTSYRNQSKLWFNDGRWWAILFDKTGPAGNGTYRIQSFNMATQAWTTSNTATQVDNRNRSNADALWDGTNLYVVSSHDHGRNWASNGALRLYKYTYSAARRRTRSSAASRRPSSRMAPIPVHRYARLRDRGRDHRQGTPTVALGRLPAPDRPDAYGSRRRPTSWSSTAARPARSASGPVVDPRPGHAADDRRHGGHHHGRPDRLPSRRRRPVEQPDGR